MGYNTRFTLGVTGPTELMDKFIEDAENENIFGHYDAALTDWLDGDFCDGEEVKWYEWKKDVTALSKEYPALLFTVKGEGEEAGDIWKAWARNGKVVVEEAKIVFDEPDLDKAIPSPDVAKLQAEALREQRAKVELARERADAALRELDKRLKML